MQLTRWLRNDGVTPEEMVAWASEATAPRCQGRRVLAIQDTTVVRSEGGGGLYLHPTVAIDADDGAVLGLVHSRFLKRSQGEAANRKSRPVGDKESQRWLDGASEAARVCAGAAQVIVVCDREGDIFAALARRPAGVDLLVRAAHDRALEDGGLLFAMLDAQPVAGRASLDLPARPGRAARTSQVEARIATVSLKRPSNALAADLLPKTLSVNLVDVRETSAPAGEQAAHWRLITTLPAGDAAQGFAVVEFYRRRWAIEQVFRTLKTKGFDIEGVLVQDEAPLRNLLTAALIAAVIIQQLVHARDGAPPGHALRPLTDAFEPEDQPILEALTAKLQGKTERQKNPHPTGSLAYGAWVCARLGGWTGYYGKPGPIVMLNGWKYFQAVKHGTLLTLPRDV